MPLIKKTDRKSTEKNFDEVRHGKTYEKTRKKSGKKRANKQMVAIVLSNKRKAEEKRRGRR
jgi:hypothetical protein